MTIRVTENELVEALFAATQTDGSGDNGAQTVNELVVTTGRAGTFVRQNLKVLLAAGRVEVVRVSRQAIDGRFQHHIPAYRLKVP